MPTQLADLYETDYGKRLFPYDMSDQDAGQSQEVGWDNGNMDFDLLLLDARAKHAARNYVRHSI